MSSFNCTAANASVDVTCTPAASSVSTASNSGSPVPPPPSGDTNAAPTPAAPLPPSSDPSLTEITEEQFDNSVELVKTWLDREIPDITGVSFQNAFKGIAYAIQSEFNISIDPAFRAIKELNDGISPSEFAIIMNEDYKMESERINTLKADIEHLVEQANSFPDNSTPPPPVGTISGISQLIKKILQLVAQTMSQIASNYSKSITENIQLIDSDLLLKQQIYESLSRIQSRKENTFASVEEVQWDKVGLSVLVYYAIKRMITLLGEDGSGITNIDQPSFKKLFNQPTAPEKKVGGKNSSKKRKRKPKRKTIKRKRPKRKTIKRKHPKRKRLSKKRV